MAGTPEQMSKRDGGRAAVAVLLGLAAGLLVWFVVSNSQKVEIHFWVTSTHASLIAVILISAALGAVIGILLARSRRR